MSLSLSLSGGHMSMCMCISVRYVCISLSLSLSVSGCTRLNRLAYQPARFSYIGKAFLLATRSMKAAHACRRSDQALRPPAFRPRFATLQEWHLDFLDIRLLLRSILQKKLPSSWSADGPNPSFGAVECRKITLQCAKPLDHSAVAQVAHAFA